jgi:large-conductance mechanosensitive channel
MLSFLLEEGVISVGAISGIFTATLLGSFKSNILDPISEKIAPTHLLDPNIQNKDIDQGKKKENMINVLDANNYNFYDPKTQTIKWKIFLKDLIIWIIIMFILYLIWNYLIRKISGVSPPVKK